MIGCVCRALTEAELSVMTEEDFEDTVVCGVCRETWEDLKNTAKM